jgi:hypothetical protein
VCGAALVASASFYVGLNYEPSPVPQVVTGDAFSDRNNPEYSGCIIMSTRMTGRLVHDANEIGDKLDLTKKENIITAWSYLHSTYERDGRHYCMADLTDTLELMKKEPNPEL